MKLDRAKRIMSALTDAGLTAKIISAGNRSFSFHVIDVDDSAYKVEGMLSRFRGLYVEHRTNWGCWIWDASEYSEAQALYTAQQIVHDGFWEIQHIIKTDAGSGAAFRALKSYYRAISDYIDVYGDGATYPDGSNYLKDYDYTVHQVENYISDRKGRGQTRHERHPW